MTNKPMTPKEFARFLYLENHGPNKTLSYHCEAGTADLFLEPLITQYTAAIRQAGRDELLGELYDKSQRYGKQFLTSYEIKNLKSQPEAQQ